MQRDDPAVGLRDVHAEDEPDAGVLPANVCLALTQLNVRVPQLQNPRTVDAAKHTSYSGQAQPGSKEDSSLLPFTAALHKGRMSGEGQG